MIIDSLTVNTKFIGPQKRGMKRRMEKARHRCRMAVNGGMSRQAQQAAGEWAMWERRLAWLGKLGEQVRSLCVCGWEETEIVAWLKKGWQASTEDDGAARLYVVYLFEAFVNESEVYGNW